MRIAQLQPEPNWVLSLVSEDGRTGYFDVRPYLEYEAFSPLRDPGEFKKIVNGRYFVEWHCGADLSADTIEARWRVVGKADVQAVAQSDEPLILAFATA